MQKDDKIWFLTTFHPPTPTMPGSAIQFHALRSEMLQLVKECVDEFNLHILAIRFPPYEGIRVAVDDLDDVFADGSPYDEVGFTLAKPKLPTATAQLCDRNPDCLSLQIGKKTRRGLEESCLSYKTDNAEALAVWKMIAGRLKKMTNAGVAVVNPETGVSGFQRTFRYTAGAKDCECKGIPILALGGKKIHRLGVGKGSHE